MGNPIKAAARQFLLHDSTILFALGVFLSLIDLVLVYGAAVRDGVLRIPAGVGLFNHYGFWATICGNAIALYAAKKYYDYVCGIKKSRALVDDNTVKKPLSELTAMIELRGRYRFILYGLMVFGALCWMANFGIHTLANPVDKWGAVFDSFDHRWSFVAGRIHLLYSWIVLMPLVGHLMICSSIQLRRIVAIAAEQRALQYDLLNPDQRGGFGFVENALLVFNIIVGLIYVQVTLHIETFARVNLEHVVDYIMLTVMLLGINRMFFSHIYTTIRALRVEALNKVKEEVFHNNKLSFEILKYCYERRLSPAVIANGVVKAAAIIVPGVVKFWPFIVNALPRG